MVARRKPKVDPHKRAWAMSAGGSGERWRMAKEEGLAEVDEAHKKAVEETLEKLKQSDTLSASDYGKVLQTQKRKELIRKTLRGE